MKGHLKKYFRVKEWIGSFELVPTKKSCRNYSKKLFGSKIGERNKLYVYFWIVVDDRGLIDEFFETSSVYMMFR